MKLNNSTIKATVQHYCKEDEPFLNQNAMELILRKNGCGVSSLQRFLKIGYNLAAQIVKSLEHRGFISETKDNINSRDITADIQWTIDLPEFDEARGYVFRFNCECGHVIEQASSLKPSQILALCKCRREYDYSVI